MKNKSEIRPSSDYVDSEEVAEAFRMLAAQKKAKALGIKLPYSIAKKLYCRCGKEFVHPLEFLEHRRDCEKIKADADLLRRKPKEPEPEPIAEVEQKKKKYRFAETCRCGFMFHKKAVYNRHQKICSNLKEASDLFARGAEYLERNKEEPNKRKSRGKHNRRNTKRGKKNT